MRKVFPRTFAVLVAIGLLCGVMYSQSGARNNRRRVRGHILASTYLPPVSIKFDRAFVFAGSQKFVQYNRSRVEQFFFVDADAGRRIKRIYTVEFKGYLPNIEATYNYSMAKTIDLGKNRYVVTSGIAPNVQAVLNRNPQSDVAHAVSFLASRGYQISEAVMFQRFVQVVDKARRNELVLTYAEDLSEAGFTPTDFREGGRGVSQKEKALQELSNRALKGFTIRDNFR